MRRDTAFWACLLVCGFGTVSGYVSVSAAPRPWSVPKTDSHPHDLAVLGTSESQFECGKYQGNESENLLSVALDARVQGDAASGRLMTQAGGLEFIYDDVWVVQDDGTLVFSGSNAFDTNLRSFFFARGSGGAYTVNNAAFLFDSVLGSAIYPGDDGAVQMNLPFAFPLGGQSWTRMYVSGNGVITFGAVPNPSGYYDPADFYNSTPKIAGYYMDLGKPSGPPGGVYVKTEPSKTTVTWNRVPAYGTSQLNTFQVILFANGSFLVTYNGIASTLAVGNPIVTGFNPGGSAPLDAISFSSDVPHLGGANAVYEEYFSYSSPVVNEVALFKRFYARFPDQFFQLIYFTNFVQSMSGFANEVTIKNDVVGLGQPTFDYSQKYGSKGALESRCNMNRLSVWNDDPYARVFGKENSFLSIMAQEAGHRWGAFLLFDDGGGKSNLLLGRANSHWSYFADVDHSSLEGGDWVGTGTNTFVCPTQVDYYSHLDEYLMGLRTAQEVNPVYYIKSATNDLFANRSVGTPLKNVTTTGSYTPVPMDHIIRANGARYPTEAAEGKDLRQAFILLLKAGTTPTPAELAKIAGFRRAWEQYFEKSCDGRLTANTSLSTSYPVAAVCGIVRDQTTGEPISGFTANSWERNFYQQVPAGGRFTFRYQDDALRGTAETATIMFAAPGYRSESVRVTVPYGSTNCADVFLSRSFTLTPAGETPAGATELLANYPNPFNPSTTIRYRLASPGRVQLMVFDAAGRRVRTLVDEERAAGSHDVTFDGRDDAGAAIASGVYFYRLDADGFSQTRKMVLLK